MIARAEFVSVVCVCVNISEFMIFSAASSSSEYSNLFCLIAQIFAFGRIDAMLRNSSIRSTAY